MASTFTNNLGIQKPGTGDQSGTWGDTVNTNSDILDIGVNGVLSLSLSGTSSSLTTTDGAISNGQYKCLLLAGSPSGTHTITIAPNDAQKIYHVYNGTGQSVVFTQGSGGNATVATLKSAIIYANGAGAAAQVSRVLSESLAIGATGSVDSTALTGNIPSARITTALNATTGTTPLYACRTWVNFNGNGTPTIRASGNVSSITDNGVGDYTVNFTTAFSDTNYSVVGTVSAAALAYISALNIHTLAVGSVRVLSFFIIGGGSSSASFDPSQVNIAIFR